MMNQFILFLDHSGRISKVELKKVLHALNIKANDSEVQQLLTQMDTDNSGEIDFNEFKNVMGASFFKKHSKKEIESAFRKFDSDGNGYITSAELNHILSRMGRHLSRNDIDAMVKSLDSSGDGKISFDEFCKLFD
jgi:Ca2+-binding EF-hand superfamily protein